MSNLTDTFERVQQILEQLDTSGSQVKTAQDTVEQYQRQDDKAKEVPPEDFTKELDELLKETVPGGTNATPEADEDTEKEMQDAHPATTDVESVQGEPEAPTEGPKAGDEAEKELKSASVAELSDDQLLEEYVKTGNALLKQVAELYDNGIIASSEEEVIGRTIKQAEYDADMVIGFLNQVAFLKQAQEEGEKDNEAATSETPEASETLPESPSAEEIAEAAETAGVTPEQLEALAEIMPETEEDVGGVVPPGGGLPDLFSALVAAGAEPEEIAQAVDELSEELAQAGGEEGGESEEGEEEKKEEGEEAGEGVAEELAEGSEEAAKEEGGEEELNADEMAKEINAALGEGETKGTTEEEISKAAAYQDFVLQELSNTLAELGWTPEDMVTYANQSPRRDEAVKLAAALKSFAKRNKVKLSTASSVEQRRLRDNMKAYLLELVRGS